jgi:hypothetical protein
MTNKAQAEVAEPNEPNARSGGGRPMRVNTRPQEEMMTMETMTNEPNEVQDAFGTRWPNAETEIVQAYLANKTSVMLEVREAARTYFGSPYRVWNESVPAQATVGTTFADYARGVVIRATSKADPGHDADETLTTRLVERSLGRVDWQAISAWWQATAISECEVHSADMG